MTFQKYVFYASLFFFANLQALLHISSSSPEGTWDNKLKWTPEPCTALKGYRIAVMIDDDNGPLSESAGADILHIHEEAPTSSQDAFETWWGTQMQKALEEKLALVVVASSSKKCKKFSDWLKHDDNVRYTNPKNLAKAKFFSRTTFLFMRKVLTFFYLDKCIIIAATNKVIGLSTRCDEID